MSKIFFTGDLHFGHKNVLAFDHRPFETVEEMDAELIRRWNNKVGKGDLVYVLGDMIWKSKNGEAANLIKSLNGQIILIKGNHDRFLHNAAAKDALAGIKDYDDICVTLEDGTKKRVILSHYCIPMYNGHHHHAIHLHAHSHFTDEADCEVDYAAHLNNIGCPNEIYNVGCMYWNYEPVTLDEVLAHGKTISPYYGQTIQKHNHVDSDESLLQEDGIVWKAFYHSWNRKTIEPFNIFRHSRFREEVRDAAKRCKTKEEFAKKLRSALMYYYWCKCEWEVLIAPWVDNNSTKEIKVDVYQQVMLNWDAFLNYVWDNRTKL